MRRIGLAAFAVLLAALIGCASLEQRVIGKWSGEIKPPNGQKMGDFERQLLASMGRLEMELKGDKTFTAQVSIVPIEGTWAVEGGSLVLDPNKAFGFLAKGSGQEQPRQKIRMTLSGDGKLLTSVPDKPTDSILVFKKEP